MPWQSLSRRLSGSGPDGPYEGVPDHLRPALVQWLRNTFRLPNGHVEEQSILGLGNRLRVPVDVDSYAHTMSESLIEWAGASGENFLDLVDGVLGFWGTRYNDYNTVASLLNEGASAWTVGDDGLGLVRVVTAEAQETFELAVQARDAAAEELQTAWSNAFGRNGDASDAWDHAIKAVEDVLIPVVVPNHSKATLSHVLGQIGSPATTADWEMVLPGGDKTHDVAPLVAMLRLMWPNHDRHGGVAAKRTPSIDEARAVVTLAATIVQWHHQGWIIRKR